MLTMVYADERGNIFDQPGWQALGAAGSRCFRPFGRGEVVALPPGADLMFLPGRRPLGQHNRRLEVLAGRLAVAAILPIGYTRTMVPAYRADRDARQLPFFGYTAVGYGDGRLWAAAIRTSAAGQWRPGRFGTPDLPERIEHQLRAHPDNRIVGHLARCASQWGCPTAQNFFYRRWEMGLPTTAGCNADCLGCISRQPAGGCPAPHSRIAFKPTVGEIVSVALGHLTGAANPIVSFGQGCEGEPLLSADLLAEAIRVIRRRCRRGMININTNAGRPDGLAKLLQAGLDGVRVSMISARPATYQAYYRAAYSWEAVGESLELCRRHQVFWSLNFLLMPGLNDSPDEMAAWRDFLRRYQPPMIQFRNLNIDPGYFWRQMPRAAGPPLGVREMIGVFRQEFPGIRLGNHTIYRRRRG
ncbi:MAG: radical SAM protein [Negativicutes bacterium]|nr:radical SAM protein [Negativicutes bacterium]